MFCKSCGREIVNNASVCVGCGVATGFSAQPARAPKSRTAFVLLGIFLGGLGIHNFFAGYTAKGVIQLLITLLLGWLIIPLIGVWNWVIIEVCTVTADAAGEAFV
jgi:TM2 domain-containing membrane protein YozV